MSKTDKNYPPGEFADIHDEQMGIVVLDPPNGGADYDDIMHLSGTTGCTFDTVIVKGGLQRENAVDFNNGSSDNTIRQLTVGAGKQCALYLKGGSCRNKFPDVVIIGAGGHSDIYLGDYSDQTAARSDGNEFGYVRRADGKPVRVAWNFLRAEKPVFSDPRTKVRYQYVLSLLRTFYVELKYRFPKLIP
jgi:hypothetical protein